MIDPAKVLFRIRLNDDASSHGSTSFDYRFCEFSFEFVEHFIGIAAGLPRFHPCDGIENERDFLSPVVRDQRM